MKVWVVNEVFEWGEEGEGLSLYSTYEKARDYVLKRAYKQGLKEEYDDVWHSIGDNDRETITISEMTIQ